MQFSRSMRAAVVALVLLCGCKTGSRNEPDKKPAGGETTKPQAGAAAASGDAAGQAGGADKADKVAVTLQLNWTPEPEFGGFYAAKHRDLYSKENLDVTIRAGAAGIQTWTMVATGKVPFAIASADEIVRARLKDADLVAVLAVYQTNPHALMVHDASGVSSLGEIFTSGKIKKVAMESGLPYVHFIKKKYGFGKVEVLQYGNNLSLFLQDPKMAQQCFVFSEPISAMEQGVAVRVFSVADSGYNPYMTVVITSEAYMAEHRDVVERFVLATRAGWRAYLDDPEPTNEYMKEEKSPMSLSAMKLAAELQKSYVETDETRANYLGYMKKERWDELAAQMVELGEIEAAPDTSKLFVAVPPR